MQQNESIEAFTDRFQRTRRAAKWQDDIRTATLFKRALPIALYKEVSRSLLNLPLNIMLVVQASKAKLNSIPDPNVVMVVDVFTRFCVLKAMPDKSSHTIALALRSILSLFGSPKIIQSDNGTEYVNEIIRKFTEVSGVDHRLITKTDPFYIGNYTIVRKNQGGSYILVDGTGVLLPRNIPPSHIKVISEEQSEIYNVEAVVDHKGTPGSWLYLVSWKGYDAKDDTWEPEKHFHDNRPILKYWNRRNGQRNVEPNSNKKRPRGNHDNSQALGYGQNQVINEEYGCPACYSHFPEINSLHSHIQEVHVKQNNEHVSDESEEDGNTNATRVSIATDSSKSIDFSATHNIYEQHLPKLSKDCLKLLEPISFTHVHAFLLAALEQSLDALPRWIWTQINEDIANISHEYQLLQASKFILTTFADNCTQKKQQKTNSERTYWIRHIVHIFQSFANQTGYLQFKWCESQTKQHALAEINLNNWKKPTARFCDGLGFDWLGKERLSMEGSSGQHEERIDHTISDTAKQISNTIAMLKGFTRENMDASFETLRKVKIFGVQAVEKMIILTETSYDEESTKYLFKVVRTVRIPIEYEERYNWLKVFELLAYLLVELKEQEQIYETLNKEQTSIIIVHPEETVRIKLSVGLDDST
ncbi:hypothetical protein G6F20_002154 [Rhizopus arrhizus]|nr:hypothetical protein G6F20_002154 [Rhizopus arrhizus]